MIDVGKEKDARAALLAATERVLSKDCTVILDAPNYIKGYRYQLYCLARAASTPHALLWCQPSSGNASNEEACREIYGEGVWQAMLDRFEEPDGNNRWDTPLFIAENGKFDQAEELWSALNDKPKKAPSLATRSHHNPSAPSTPTDTIDTVVQSICEPLAKAIRSGAAVYTIKDDSANLLLSFRIDSRVTLTWLQTVRRDFMHLNRLRPVVDQVKVRALFVDYLKSQLQPHTIIN